MKIDKEFLMKNRFWVLLGTAVLLVLICLGLVFLGPAKKASAAADTYAKTRKDYDNVKDPKNASFLPPWVQREKLFKDAKNAIWEKAWLTQTDLRTKTDYMTLPGRIGSNLTTPYFGDTITSDDLDSYKNTLYAAQFPTKESPSLDAFLALRGDEQAYFPIEYETKVLGQIAWKVAPDT